MRSSHVGALSPFRLDRIPSVFGRPCSLYSKSCDIGTIQGNVSSRKLVPEDPFVMVRFGGVDWCGIRSRLSGG